MTYFPSTKTECLFDKGDAVRLSFLSGECFSKKARTVFVFLFSCFVLFCFVFHFIVFFSFKKSYLSQTLARKMVVGQWHSLHHSGSRCSFLCEIKDEK